MLRQFLISICLINLTGCAIIYKQPISQGNTITRARASQIHNGMSVRQVVNKIGTPVMTNMYPENRLVYVYSLKKGHQALETQRLIISFRNKHVVNVAQS